GPWIVLGWIGATAAVVVPLIVSGQLTTLTWQIVTTVLVAAVFLWLAVSIFHRAPRLAFDTNATALEARYLSKVYGRAGPVKRAWRLGRDGGDRVARTRRDASERALTFGMLLAGPLYMTLFLDSMTWRLLFAYLAAAFAARAVIELRYMVLLRNGVHEARETQGSLFDSIVLTLAPWTMLAAFAYAYTLQPAVDGTRQALPPVAVVL